MSRVALYLLGPPRLDRDGATVRLKRRKALALLAYLAMKPGDNSRDALAELLYGALGRDRSRSDLRPLISLLAGALGQGVLQADRQSVAVVPGRGLWIDVAQHRRLLDAARASQTQGEHARAAKELTAAVPLYRGEFLSGFYLADCPDFEDWQLQEQEGLRREQSWALQGLTALHAEREQYDQAIFYARQRVALDPLEEEVHRQLMLLLARAGRRVEALRQYETCVEVLERELGESPGEETESLRSQIASEAPTVGARPRSSAKPVVTPSSPEGSDPAGTGLVGRNGEYARFAACLDCALRGEGRLVVITGEAGVGKSRLVRELRDRALRAARSGPVPLWLEGGCMELGAAVAYWPFIDMLGRFFGANEGRGMVQTDRSREPRHPGQGNGEQGLAARVADALEGLRLQGRITAQRKEELGPLLGRLLSIRFGNDWDRKLAKAQPQQIKGQMFLAIRDLLLALADGGSLVLVLEDLQWADPLSVQVIPLLMECVTSAPLLIVCVYRPERDSACCRLPAVAARQCPERFVEIALRELGPLESRLLVETMLDGRVLPTDVVQSVLEQAGGNPFFVEEIVRSLIDAGALYRKNGHWHVRPDFRSIELPATVQGIIQARVERLEEGLKLMLQSASVMGRIFRRRILELTAEKQEAVKDALSELAARALITADPAAPDERYVFRHDLTRQAVYQGILEHRRTLLHRRTAEAIEALYHESLQEYCEQLAFHHEMAGDSARAVEYLLSAGERAADAYMNDEAVGYFARALSILESCDDPGSERRLRALTQMGKVYEVAGMHSLAEARLREAADLGRRIGLPARDLARILYLLCKTLSASHNPSAYLSIAREGLALLSNDPSSTEALLLETVLAYGSFDSGDFARAHEFVQRIGHVVRAQPYSSEVANVAGFITLIWLIRKDKARALEWLEWLEREARKHNDLMCAAATLLRRGRDMHARGGDLPGAVSMIEQAAQMYHGLGAKYLETRAQLSLGDVCYRFGHLDQAEELCGSAAAIRADIGNHPHLLVENELLRGQISLSRGNTAQALEAFRGALALEPGEQWKRYLLLLAGRCLTLQGQKRAARDCFRELLAPGPTLHLPPAFFLTASPALILGFLEDCCDDAEEYRGLCEEVRAAGLGRQSAFPQASLEPCHAAGRARLASREDFRDPVAQGWAWRGEYPDSRVPSGGGLVLHAASGQGLQDMNLTAPRLLRSASGDLAAEVVCAAAHPGKPGAGGLLLWKDASFYLRLDHGSCGPRDAVFSGCIGGTDVVVGRGRMHSRRACLRIERSGASVRALCSEDGHAWNSLGCAEFPVDDTLEVGIFADGALAPELYPQNSAEGSSVRFESFQLWL
jgi:DNA-binding SARP family transcriptional activator